MVMKNSVPCKKDAHASIRRWHQTFQETLMQCGVYVHPLWLFRKNHGGEWGFQIGDTADDDLPTPLQMTCQQSSTLIYQLMLMILGKPLSHGASNMRTRNRKIAMSVRWNELPMAIYPDLILTSIAMMITLVSMERPPGSLSPITSRG